MRYLGIDWGEKRWGISYGDELGIATPMDAIIDTEIAIKWEKLRKLVVQRHIQEFVVGYPYNMDGSIGFKAKEVDQFINELIARFPTMPVSRIDERLTSHTAGMNWSEKQKRQHRKSGKLDSSAAAILLQDFLDQQSIPALPEPNPESNESSKNK